MNSRIEIANPTVDDLLEQIHADLNHAKITSKDAIHELTDLSNTLSEAIPQLNYAGFSSYTVLIPLLLTTLQKGIMLPQPSAIGLGWNMADAILQIIGGALQIRTAINKDTSQPVALGIEGGINVGSGIQLIILTSLTVTLGAIGFAVAFGVASTFAIKNAILAAKKCIDEDYYIKNSLEILTLSQKKLNDELCERQKQINDLNARKEKECNIQKNLEEEINEANLNMLENEKLSSETINVITASILYFIENQLKKSQQDIEDLQTDIFARLVTNYVEKGSQSYLKIEEVNFDQFTPSQAQCLKDLKNLPINAKANKVNDTFAKRKESVNSILNKESLNHIVPPKGFLKTYDECQERTQSSNEECRKEASLKAIDAFYITLAFAGMVCLCIPVAQAFAPFFIAPAAAYFTAKYSVQIAKTAQSICSFFSKKQYVIKTTNESHVFQPIQPA